MVLSFSQNCIINQEVYDNFWGAGVKSNGLILAAGCCLMKIPLLICVIVFFRFRRRAPVIFKQEGSSSSIIKYVTF